MEDQETSNLPEIKIATRPSTPTTRDARKKSQLSSKNTLSRPGKNKEMKLDNKSNKSYKKKVKKKKKGINKLTLYKKKITELEEI